MSLRSIQRALSGVALAAALGAPLWAQPQQPTRVMPIGDSLTQGGNGHASWRYRLWFSLTRSQAVDFVGTRNTLFGGDGPTNPNPTRYPFYFAGFDRDHEGYWGRRATEVETSVHAATLVARPDIVLVLLGTNDIGQSGAAGVQHVESALNRIIDDVRAARPAARIFVAKTLPIAPTSFYGSAAPLIPALHQAIVSVVQAKTTPASPVRLVDPTAAFDLATHMQPDGVHPNTLGETHIADAWAQALLAHWAPTSPPTRARVSVLDSSAEGLALGDGQSQHRPDGTPWRFGTSGNTQCGVFDPNGATYINAAGSGTPLGGHGEQVLFLADLGSGNETLAGFQTLATTFEPRLDYRVTVAVGRRLASAPGGLAYGGFRIELLAGDTVVGSATDTLLPTAGRFQDVSFVVDAGQAPPGLHGQALTIRLGLTGTGANIATDFDHVRLAAY